MLANKAGLAIDVATKALIERLVKDQVQKELSAQLTKKISEETRRVLSKEVVMTGARSYDSLRMGAVNAMENSNVSMNDVYGKTILGGNPTTFNNETLYKRMKNKIQYGVNPDTIALNKGQRRIP